MLPTDCCVVALQETWLDETVDDDVIEIREFELFRADRNHTKKKHGGGVCTYVRKSWCNKSEILEPISNDNLDLLIVKSHRFIFMNVYVNIIRQDEHILNIIRDLVNKYIDVYTIFLLGDFNRLSFNKTIFNADLFNIVNFPTRDNAYLDHVYNREISSFHFYECVC